MIYKKIPADLTDLWENKYLAGVDEEGNYWCIDCLLTNSYEGDVLLVENGWGICENCKRKIHDFYACDCPSHRKVKGS